MTQLQSALALLAQAVAHRHRDMQGLDRALERLQGRLGAPRRPTVPAPVVLRADPVQPIEGYGALARDAAWMSSTTRGPWTSLWPPDAPA